MAVAGAALPFPTMDESSKLLADVRNLLKRAEDRVAEDCRVARNMAMRPDGFRRYCSLVAVLCMLLAIGSAVVAVQALDASVYLALGFAGCAAVQLACDVVATWCGRNADRGGQ